MVRFCLLLGWLICHPLLHCDQVVDAPEEYLTSKAAAFVAEKIGDLQKPSDGSEPISGPVHQALHTINGAILSGATAAVTGQDVGKAALAGGSSALVNTWIAHSLIDDKTTEKQAKRITDMSELLTATLAMAVGLDPSFAYLAGHNANTYNVLGHLDTLKHLGIVKEGEEVTENKDLGIHVF